VGQGLETVVNSPAPQYQVACARIVGRSHRGASTPCQDYVGGRRMPYMAAVALADGAGSRARSEVGAETAVRACLRMLFRHFEDLYATAEEDVSQAASVVHAALLKELEAVALELGCRLDELASTLLFVAHKGGRSLVGHLGDGVVALVDADSNVMTVSAPDNGEFANATYFLTDPQASLRLRIYAVHHERLPKGYVLMSDGTAESLYSKARRKPADALRSLLDWNATLTRARMKKVLSHNMEHVFSTKTTDDCSLGLLTVSA
jgi:serine/threonine protein phosphatase PrpC